MSIETSLLSIAWSISVLLTIDLLGHDHAATLAWMW